MDMLIQGDGKKISPHVAFKRWLVVKVNTLMTDATAWREFKLKVEGIKQKKHDKRAYYIN